MEVRFALAIPAAQEFREIFADGEELLGNHPDNDYCIALETSAGSNVYIRPMDARVLREAAETARKLNHPVTLCVQDGERLLGHLELQHVVDVLQGY